MANENKKPILYSYFRSSSSWRVRAALAYKGIDYEYKAVNLVNNEQNSDEYVKLNPYRQVPTLQIDGLTLTQSLPIIEYLEETRPDKNLLPKDPAKRAKARQIAEIVNSGIQPLQNTGVQMRVKSISNEEKKNEWVHFYVRKGFEALEAILRDSAGKFSVGDEVTIADLCLVPQVYGAKRYGVDLTDFPTVNRVNDACVVLDFFKAASFDAQPDAV